MNLLKVMHELLVSLSVIGEETFTWS